MEITITHTAAAGTLIAGFGREDKAIHEAIKPLFRYSARVAAEHGTGWYIRGSRDQKPRTVRIESVAATLRRMGHDVTVELDTSLRPTADVEADRTARLADRADALAAKADRKGREANATIDRARDMASIIPLGQPVMPDHYSYKRDISYRNKISDTFDRGFRALGEAQEVERRAEVAGKANERRQTAPATMRRIAKLEATERKAVHNITRCEASGLQVPDLWLYKGKAQCPVKGCGRHEMTPTEDGRYPEHTPGDVAHWSQVLDETREQLTHWRAHLASLEEDGVKVWGPADFKKGDLVQYWGGWREVVRVNKKSLSVKTDHTWTDKVTYDDVRGCRTIAQDASEAPAVDDDTSPGPSEPPAAVQPPVTDAEPEPPAPAPAPAEDDDEPTDLLAWLDSELGADR